MRCVLVCGGRDYADRAHMDEVLGEYLHRYGTDLLVVHGAARGADAMAGRWAADNGIHAAAVPALWGSYGNRAGTLRNRAMLSLADEVVAFPGGRGTADMVARAQGDGVPTLLVPAR